VDSKDIYGDRAKRILQKLDNAQINNDRGRRQAKFETRLAVRNGFKLPVTSTDGPANHSILTMSAAAARLVNDMRLNRKSLRCAPDPHSLAPAGRAAGGLREDKEKANLIGPVQTIKITEASKSWMILRRAI
jgi:hypothetical protein